MGEENIRLKKYLLGNLPEDGISEIDLRVIEDDSLTEDLALAESELIEDYIEGSLSDEELSLFHSNFLTSPERKQQLRETSLLKTYVLRPMRPVEAARTARFDFGNFLKTYMRPLMAGFAVVFVAVVAVVVWQLYFAGGMSPLEKEYAELNKKDLSNMSGLSVYSAVSLSSGSFRDANSAVKQDSEKLTDTVLLRLALPAGSDAGSNFKVGILKGSTLVFTQNELHSYQNPGGNEVRVLIPKSILQKGQYQIRLENAAKADQPLTFGVSIE